MRTVLVLTAIAAAVVGGAPAARIDAAADVRGPRTETPLAPRARLVAKHVACDFEGNRGQTAPSVDYLARCDGYVAFLTGGDAVIRTGSEALRMHLVGARAAKARASSPRPGRSNYFVGDDAAHWLADIPHVGRVEYDDVLPGVNVTYRTAGRELAFDLVLAPGADPGAVRLAVDGVKWLGPDAGGDLSMGLPSGGTARLSAPRAWQGDGVQRRDVTVAFARGAAANEVGFVVGAFDATKPLVIDPSLTVSTYFGGALDELPFSIHTDAAGAIYLTGRTFSNDFPTTTGVLRTTKGDSSSGLTDGFVTKLDASGTTVLFSTYLGGNSNDQALDLAVGAGGAIYVGGSTNSTDFPLQNAFQSTVGGGFLLKLNSTGSALTWSTYYPYSAVKVGLDSSENLYAFNNGLTSAMNSAGTSVLYSVAVSNFSPPTFTFTSMAVDPSGAVWVGGYVTNNGQSYSTGGAYQASHAGGANDGWIVQLNASGAEVYRTYLGGNGDDQIRAIALDAVGNVFVAGSTTSTNFPTANAYQSTKGSGTNTFVTKLNTTATALTFSTYLGGSGTDLPNGITTNVGKEVLVAGTTNSSDFPTSGAAQSVIGGNSDAYVAEFNSTGSLNRSTFLGGAGADSATAIAPDVNGRPLIVGTTQSSNFPGACAVQSTLRGGTDGFLAGISTSAAMTPDQSPYVLAQATVGRSYSQQMAVAGGTAPFTWTLRSGTIPGGLSLSTGGLLSGTPSAATSAALFVKIVDSGSQCAVREFRVTVNAAPTVTSSTLAPWTVDRPYGGAVASTGGTAPLTWDLTSGAMPPGMQLASDGSLIGTPTASGTFNFSARVIDANGASAVGAQSILIHPAPILVAVLQPWTEGRHYVGTPAVIGGTPPFAWSLVSGSLPVDKPLNPATGVLDGTALAAGDYAFTVRATDAAGATAQDTFTMHVNAIPTITTLQMPVAAKDRPYAAPVATAGGTTPFRWSLRTGSFGTGFTGLDPDTGILGGTPTVTGRTTAEVQLVDASGVIASSPIRILVAPRTDVAKGKATETFAIASADGGADVVRYVELLGGTTVSLTAKVTHANQFGIDLLLLDSAEQSLDLAPYKKSKNPTVSAKGVPVPRTGRYLVVVRPIPAFTGSVTLTVTAAAATKWRGPGVVDPAGQPFAVPFAAPPGSKIVASVAAVKNGLAVPTIVGLKDSSGAELLVPAEVKTSKHGASLTAKTPLLGGDYVLTVAPNGGPSGSVTWSVTVKPPKGYPFTLIGLPVTGQ